MSGSNSAVSTRRGNNEMTLTALDKALGAEDRLTDYKDDIPIHEKREERFERVKDVRWR